MEKRNMDKVIRARKRYSLKRNELASNKKVYGKINYEFI